MMCNDKHGEVIEFSICSIDRNLKYHKKRYVFKPRGNIDPRSTKVHGYTDEFFKQSPKRYDHFNRKIAREIREYLK